MYSVRLAKDQAELLLACAEAYASPHERTGQKESIIFFTTNAGTLIQHHGLDDRTRRVSMGDLEELSGHGLIDINYRSQTQGNFRVTGAGFEAVEQIKRQEDALAEPAVVPDEGKRMGLQWQSEVLPVLRTVNELYPSVPSDRGVTQEQINEKLGRDKRDPHTGLVLRKLEEAGYVEGKMRVDEVEGPWSCGPAAKALELLAGWPTERGDAALAQLIAALERKIEETPDEVEKGKLRQVLTSVREVGQGVMVGVLSEVIRAHTGI